MSESKKPTDVPSFVWSLILSFVLVVVATCLFVAAGATLTITTESGLFLCFGPSGMCDQFPSYESDTGEARHAD